MFNKFPVILYLFGQIFIWPSYIEPIKMDVPNVIGAILNRIEIEFHRNNWTENAECLIELNSIKNGIENNEEWVTKLVDSWRDVMFGILSGRLPEYGSFSDCFRIKRNGQPYQTQYCLGLPIQSQMGSIETLLAFDHLLGICLPAACETNHFEFALNGLIRTIDNNTIIKIPKNVCQREENAIVWKPIDYFTVGLFGIVLILMLVSTGYDIFCIVYKRAAYQPFIVFSIYTNGKRLFSVTNLKKSPEKIHCIDGIRVFSTLFIVLGHTYVALYSMSPLRNREIHIESIKSYLSPFLNPATTVDSLFVASGFLVASKMFPILEKTGKLDVLSLYWNRYLRLTALLGVLVLEAISLQQFYGNGPIWPIQIQNYINRCERNWWSTLLFVGNYVHTEDMCIRVSWFFCVDLQLFIVAPAFVYLIHRFEKTTLIALLASILCCLGYSLPLFLKNRTYAVQREYYFTHIRFPAWLIGFITGYILFKFPKGSIRIPKNWNLCAWTVVSIVMSVIWLACHELNQVYSNAPSIQYALCETLGRITWSIALCYLIFACAQGSGGPVNAFLSLPMWQPISKLSYHIMLCHYSVMGVITLSAKTPLYFDEFSTIENFISFFVLSTAVAIPFVLAFELPIDAIMKLNLTNCRSAKSSSKVAPTSTVEKTLSSPDYTQAGNAANFELMFAAGQTQS